MADKLIETIARWLCEERDPGIMLTDPGYWTRYKPEAMELIAALDKAGMTWTWKEPTEAMMAAGVKANDAYAAEVAPCSAFRSLDCYRAMLAAKGE